MGVWAEKQQEVEARVHETANLGEMGLLVVYKLLTGGRKWRFKKCICYRICNIFCNSEFIY